MKILRSDSPIIPPSNKLWKFAHPAAARNKTDTKLDSASWSARRPFLWVKHEKLLIGVHNEFITNYEITEIFKANNWKLQSSSTLFELFFSLLSPFVVILKAVIKKVI